MEFGISNLPRRRRESRTIDRIVEATAETVKLAGRADFTTAWLPERHHASYPVERFAFEVMPLVGKEPGGPATAAAG